MSKSTGTILLVYSLADTGSPGDITDHWEVCDSMADAERLYEEVLELEGIYIASICGVIKSTDYRSPTCTHTKVGWRHG